MTVGADTGLAPAIDVRGLVKRYGANTILRRVDLSLRDGEIHALLGENGAGKSTLIKVLAGAVPRDGGDIDVHGVALPAHHTPSDVRHAGIAFVHQHLALFDDLSVAENVALTAGYRHRRGAISFRDTERGVARWLDEVGAKFQASTPVGRLAQDEKVLCALARAFAAQARIIVLDEVSASLPAPEMDRLAVALKAAKREGTSYLFVTHRLTEVFQLADRVTVLRDGEVALSAPTASVTRDEVVRHILGKTHVHQRAQRTGGRSGPPRLRVRGLLGAGLAGAVDFEIAAGEVLAVCGLVGSGTRAVARLLGGAAAPAAGVAELDGVALPLGVPHRLAARDCAYVPGDRPAEGALGGLSIRENLFPMRRPGRSDADGFLRWPDGERRAARDLAARFEVRPGGDIQRALSALSGGNQQKVIFGRALRTPQKLLVLEDPTAGVDIGSRAVLYGFMHQASKAGAAVLMVSTDFEEVAAHADRALVMRDGALAAEIPVGRMAHDAAELALAEASYGTQADPPATESAA